MNCPEKCDGQTDRKAYIELLAAAKIFLPILKIFLFQKMCQVS